MRKSEKLFIQVEFDSRVLRTKISEGMYLKDLIDGTRQIAQSFNEIKKANPLEIDAIETCQSDQQSLQMDTIVKRIEKCISVVDEKIVALSKPFPADISKASFESLMMELKEGLQSLKEIQGLITLLPDTGTYKVTPSSSDVRHRQEYEAKLKELTHSLNQQIENICRLFEAPFEEIERTLAQLRTAETVSQSQILAVKDRITALNKKFPAAYDGFPDAQKTRFVSVKARLSELSKVAHALQSTASPTTSSSATSQYSPLNVETAFPKTPPSAQSKAPATSAAPPPPPLSNAIRHAKPSDVNPSTVIQPKPTVPVSQQAAKRSQQAAKRTAPSKESQGLRSIKELNALGLQEDYQAIVKLHADLSKSASLRTPESHAKIQAMLADYFRMSTTFDAKFSTFGITLETGSTIHEIKKMPSYQAMKEKDYKRFSTYIHERVEDLIRKISKLTLQQKNGLLTNADDLQQKLIQYMDIIQVLQNQIQFLELDDQALVSGMLEKLQNNTDAFVETIKQAITKEIEQLEAQLNTGTSSSSTMNTSKTDALQKIKRLAAVFPDASDAVPYTDKFNAISLKIDEVKAIKSEIRRINSTPTDLRDVESSRKAILSVQQRIHAVFPSGTPSPAIETILSERVQSQHQKLDQAVTALETQAELVRAETLSAETHRVAEITRANKARGRNLRNETPPPLARSVTNSPVSGSSTLAPSDLTSLVSDRPVAPSAPISPETMPRPPLSPRWVTGSRTPSVTLRSPVPEATSTPRIVASSATPVEQPPAPAIRVPPTASATTTPPPPLGASRPSTPTRTPATSAPIAPPAHIEPIAVERPAATAPRVVREPEAVAPDTNTVLLFFQEILNEAESKKNVLLEKLKNTSAQHAQLMISVYARQIEDAHILLKEKLATVSLNSSQLAQSNTVFTKLSTFVSEIDTKVKEIITREQASITTYESTRATLTTYAGVDEFARKTQREALSEDSGNNVVLFLTPSFDRTKYLQTYLSTDDYSATPRNLTALEKFDTELFAIEKQLRDTQLEMHSRASSLSHVEQLKKLKDLLQHIPVKLTGTLQVHLDLNQKRSALVKNLKLAQTHVLELMQKKVDRLSQMSGVASIAFENLQTQFTQIQASLTRSDSTEGESAEATEAARDTFEISPDINADAIRKINVLVKQIAVLEEQNKLLLSRYARITKDDNLADAGLSVELTASLPALHQKLSENQAAIATLQKSVLELQASVSQRDRIFTFSETEFDSDSLPAEGREALFYAAYGRDKEDHVFSRAMKSGWEAREGATDVQTFERQSSMVDKQRFSITYKQTQKVGGVESAKEVTLSRRVVPIPGRTDITGAEWRCTSNDWKTSCAMTAKHAFALQQTNKAALTKQGRDPKSIQIHSVGQSALEKKGEPFRSTGLTQREIDLFSAFFKAGFTALSYKAAGDAAYRIYTQDDLDRLLNRGHIITTAPGISTVLTATSTSTRTTAAPPSASRHAPINRDDINAIEMSDGPTVDPDAIARLPEHRTPRPTRR